MVVLGLLVSLVGIQPAAAQAYPNKPIRMIVPFAPGGPADLGARPIAQLLSTKLGQPVVVVNRGGGAGSIGSIEAARSTPDGYTVTYTTSSFALAPLVYQKVGYDPIADFSPIVMSMTQPMVLVIHPKVPARSVPEFINYAKANPNSITYGSSGSGGITHLVSAEFGRRLGLELTHVPYKGSGPGVVDLIGGQILMMLTSFGTVRPHVESGRLRALAISATSRSPILPEVPTLTEATQQEYPEFGVWQGMLAPRGTPRSAITLLNSEVNAILRDPEFRKRTIAEGSVILGGPPDQFSAYMKTEMARWGKVVRDVKITPQD